MVMSEKQNAEMLQLLPCPFCGGNAELDRMGNPRQSCIVACIDCGCRLETGLEERNSGRQWNTRTAVPSPHPRGEPVGYVSAATISALGEPEGSGPIVACAAFDTLIPLYAAPPPAGADTVDIGAAYEKHAKRIFGTGPRSIDSVTHFYSGFKAALAAAPPPAGADAVREALEAARAFIAEIDVAPGEINVAPRHVARLLEQIDAALLTAPQPQEKPTGDQT